MTPVRPSGSTFPVAGCDCLRFAMTSEASASLVVAKRRPGRGSSLRSGPARIQQCKTALCLDGGRVWDAEVSQVQLHIGLYAWRLLSSLFLIVAFWVLRTTVSRGLEVGYPSAALGSEDWCNPVHGGVFSDGRPSVHGVAPSPTAPASSRVSRECGRPWERAPAGLACCPCWGRARGTHVTCSNGLRDSNKK